MSTGGSNSVKDFNSNLSTAKIMRTVGQSIFLTINVFLLYCILDTTRQSRWEYSGKPTHPTLLVLVAIWPFLFIRELYGVMSGVFPAFNYFYPANYEEKGLRTLFVISEYIMGTTMEWASCTLLMVTYLMSRNDPKKADLEIDEGNKPQSEEGGIIKE
jgi:hypothetical protein